MIILMLIFIAGTLFLFSPTWIDFSALGLRNTHHRVDLMAGDEGEE